MRRACLATLALLSCAAWARDGRFERTNSRTPQGRSERGFLGDSLAFFEAFPASGAGAGAACACGTVTGAKGEALTFTRGSSGTCTKTTTGGLATSGIANGDLVTCTTDQPRVEYDGAGVLGLLVESARTNSMTRSQEINNAAWTKYNFGSGSVPTVTADYAVAPDGTTTAERVQFSAVNAGDQSAVFQASGITTGSNTVSVYVKGTSGSGSICVQAYNSAGSTYSTCSYNATTWTRCSHTATITATGQIRLGNDSATCGGGAMTAQDVLLWGAQWEAGAYATSYIPTTSAAANRVGDWGYFDLGASTGITGGNASIAASFSKSTPGIPVSGTLLAATVSSASDTTGANSLWAYSGGGDSIKCFYGSVGASTNAVTLVAGQSRVWCAGNAGTSVTGRYNSTDLTPGTAPVAVGNLRYFNIGGITVTYTYEAVTSRVCLDPSPTRCR